MFWWYFHHGRKQKNSQKYLSRKSTKTTWQIQEVMFIHSGKRKVASTVPPSGLSRHYSACLSPLRKTCPAVVSLSTTWQGTSNKCNKPKGSSAPPALSSQLFPALLQSANFQGFSPRSCLSSRANHKSQPPSSNSAQGHLLGSYLSPGLLEEPTALLQPPSPTH